MKYDYPDSNVPRKMDKVGASPVPVATHNMGIV